MTLEGLESDLLTQISKQKNLDASALVLPAEWYFHHSAKASAFSGAQRERAMQ